MSRTSQNTRHTMTKRARLLLFVGLIGLGDALHVSRVISRSQHRHGVVVNLNVADRDDIQRAKVSTLR
jgi:hypothetical protein